MLLLTKGSNEICHNTDTFLWMRVVPPGCLQCIYNIPSFCHGTEGFNKNLPSHCILGISFNLHAGLLSSLRHVSPCPVYLGGSTLGLAWLYCQTFFCSVWPSHPHLHFLICKSILGCFMHFHTSSFIIWFGQKIVSIFLRHLLIKTCSFAVIHFEFIQVSQPLSRTAFTFVLKMQSLVCAEYAVECQILFNVLNAIWAFHMRAMISASVPPVLSMMLPRYANCVTQ